MAAEELRFAASELGRITGAVDVEDVLDVLCTDFLHWKIVQYSYSFLLTY
jgi:hypothetical protein